jgi:hypothetical protein
MPFDLKRFLVNNLVNMQWTSDYLIQYNIMKKHSTLGMTWTSDQQFRKKNIKNKNFNYS